jgi:hypothetical protein
MSFFSQLFHTAPAVNFAELVQHGAIVVDVRICTGAYQGLGKHPFGHCQEQISRAKEKGQTSDHLLQKWRPKRFS